METKWLRFQTKYLKGIKGQSSGEGWTQELETWSPQSRTLIAEVQRETCCPQPSVFVKRALDEYEKLLEEKEQDIHAADPEVGF